MSYGIIKVVPWWTPEQRLALMATFEGGGDCGGWTYDPPCGGCTRCLYMQEAYYHDEGYLKPSRAVKQLGLVFWPVLQIGWVDGLLGSYPESHDRSHWWREGRNCGTGSE